jgi:hypothetical protein
MPHQIQFLDYDAKHCNTACNIEKVQGNNVPNLILSRTVPKKFNQTTGSPRIIILARDTNIHGYIL